MWSPPPTLELTVFKHYPAAKIQIKKAFVDTNVDTLNLNYYFSLLKYVL